jgi:alpha-ketoglutarate-dependent taurine dioxygenase
MSVELIGCRVEPLTPFGLLVRPTEGASLAGLSIEALRETVLARRLVVLRGFAPFPDKAALAEYCRAWGPLLEWEFGTVFEVVERDDPQNYLFTSGSVPFHWDGAFARAVPWLQFFQCVEAPGPDAGGETTFCDTPAVLRAVPLEVRARWEQVEIEYFTDKVAHYGGRVRARLVGRHPHTGEATLRYAEPADAATVRLNTPELHVHGVPEEEVPRFLEELRRWLYDPAFMLRHAWRAGDFVIADNHALLHGRTRYRSKLPRRLWRVHIL